MALYIGIDCGTQGIKALVYDTVKKRALCEGYAPCELYADEKGAREQDPIWWLTALDSALSQALAPLSEKERTGIAGIGVSAQQHGAVLLDAAHTPLCRAKLWNDTETAETNKALIEQAGGQDAVYKELKTALQIGFTLSKIAFLRDTRPDVFEKTALVLNPKDYINFYLTGTIATEAGSACGTGLFDVQNRVWSTKMASLISSDFMSRLPPLISDTDIAGRIRPHIAKKFGLNPSCPVSAGSGDNIMAAIGTGCVHEHIAVLTLGTAGVLNIWTGEFPLNPHPLMQMQNGPCAGWLPTVNTMNATSATRAVQSLLGIDTEQFDRAVASCEPGSAGLILLPFFNGERMPHIDKAYGTWYGMTLSNMTREHMARASCEAVILALRFGRSLLTEETAFSQLRVVGGGSRSRPWRQIIADVFDTEVIGIKAREAGALGGALQAASVCGEGSLSDLCDAYIMLDDGARALPQKEAVRRYDEIYDRYLEARALVYGV